MPVSKSLRVSLSTLTTRLPPFLEAHGATRVLSTPSLLATLLETAEIAIEGTLKRLGSAMVGTLKPDLKADPEGEPRRLTETTFQEMLKEDPTLQERWIDSIEDLHRAKPPPTTQTQGPC